MPRTTVNPITGAPPYATAGVAVAFAASDTVNGNQFRITGRTLLLVRNVNAGAQTITITSTPDPYGRTGNITTDSIAASAFRVYPMFPVTGWMQSDGYLYVNTSHANVELAVIEVP